MNRYAEAVQAFRRTYLTKVLGAHDGNRSQTAKSLGMTRSYLFRLIRALGIEVPAPRRGRPISREP